MTLDPKQYETYESLILSEQMTAFEAVGLMTENPDFGEWYRHRAAARLKKIPVTLKHAIPSERGQ